MGAGPMGDIPIPGAGRYSRRDSGSGPAMGAASGSLGAPPYQVALSGGFGRAGSLPAAPRPPLAVTPLLSQGATAYSGDFDPANNGPRAGLRPALGTRPTPNPRESEEYPMRRLSTPDSVEKNEPTLLAIAETLLAVAAYWGIAWFFDTHAHLLLSISVAPLLLLRSPESTEKGVRWFAAYWNDETEITPKDTPGRFWGIVLLSGVIGAACAYVLANTFLVGHEGWALFVRAMAVGMAGWMIAFTIAGAVAVAVAGAGAVEKFAILFFGIPIAIGVWLRSLTVRVLATLRHPLRGLWALPGNWRRILWALDAHHAPELVPGLAAHDDNALFSLPGIVEEIRDGDWFDRLVFSLFLPIWFLPGLLYRWSLKSTCWLYLPLIYLGGGLGRPHTPKEKRDLVARLYRSRLEGSRRWLAIGVLASALITTALNHPALQGPIRDALSEFPPLLRSFLWGFDRLTEQASNLAYLWAFDFNGWNLAPWQWLNLLGAALTALLFFYSDRVNRAWTLAKEQDAAAAPEAAHITRLLRITRARNLCVFFYIPLAFGYCVFALGGMDVGLLSAGGWLAPLSVLYGPYLS